MNDVNITPMSSLDAGVDIICPDIAHRDMMCSVLEGLGIPRAWNDDTKSYKTIHVSGYNGFKWFLVNCPAKHSVILKMDDGTERASVEAWREQIRRKDEEDTTTCSLCGRRMNRKHNPNGICSNSNACQKRVQTNRRQS